jgi:hypothetical protein
MEPTHRAPVHRVGFEHPEWYNGFEHDPEEAARVRLRLLRELAATGEPLVATHLSFPSVCRVRSPPPTPKSAPTGASQMLPPWLPVTLSGR